MRQPYGPQKAVVSGPHVHLVGICSPIAIRIFSIFLVQFLASLILVRIPNLTPVFWNHKGCWLLSLLGSALFPVSGQGSSLRREAWIFSFIEQNKRVIAMPRKREHADFCNPKLKISKAVILPCVNRLKLAVLFPYYNNYF